MLSSMGQAGDFAALGQAAQACVARREQDEGLSPASEPQMAAGADIRPLLPQYAFSRP
jgi:hypothetical protein